MAKLDDAKQVITLLTGVAATNAQLLRIADLFIKYAGSAFDPVDPNNPTTEEKAQLFLNVMRDAGRSIIGKQVRANKILEHETDTQTSIQTAVTDF